MDKLSFGDDGSLRFRTAAKQDVVGLVLMIAAISPDSQRAIEPQKPCATVKVFLRQILPDVNDGRRWVRHHIYLPAPDLRNKIVHGYTSTK